MVFPSRLIITSIITFAIAAAARALAVGPPAFVETQTIRIDNPGPLDDLGYSLGTGGGSLIAGAINVRSDSGNDVGAAYVYRQDANGQWIENAVLKPNDGVHNDAFGWASDIFGDSAIVGVPYHDALGESSGAAYLFADAGVDGWQQVAKLVPADGDDSELFGLAVATTETTVAVGAFRHQDSPAPGTRQEKGAVYLYEKTGPLSWTPSTKLQPSDVKFGDHFGYRVDLFGDTLAATAASVQNSGSDWEGAVYLYRNDGAAWSQAAKLFPSGSAGTAYFGQQISLGDGRLLVGAMGVASTGARGGAYIYEENQLGQWVQTAELVPHDLDSRWYYGIEVGLWGDTAAVVAYSSPNGPLDPVVYVFERDGLGHWHETATLTSTRALHSFGFALTASSNQIFVSSGVNSPGMVHVFTRVPETSAFCMQSGVFIGLIWRSLRRHTMTSA